MPAKQMGVSSSGSSSSSGFKPEVKEESKLEISTTDYLCVDSESSEKRFEPGTKVVCTDRGTLFEKLSVESLKKGLAPQTLSLPPSYDITPTLKQRIRFVCAASAGATSTVTVGNLVGALGGIATSTTNISCWTSSFKIKQLTLWSAPDSSAATQGYIDWVYSSGSYAYKDQTQIYDMPQNMLVTSANVFKPRKDTLCSKWVNTQIGASTTLFVIVNIVKGDVLDLEVEHTLNIQNTAVPITITVLSAIASQSYWLPLDGVATNLWRPAVGYPTTH